MLNIADLARRHRGAPVTLSTGASLVFQLLDVQERVVDEYKQSGDDLKFSATPVHEEICSDGYFSEINTAKSPKFDDEKCMLLLFGCDEKGQSICVQTRYSPYCYVEIPDEWTTDADFIKFMNALANQKVRLGKYVYERRHHLSGWQSDEQDPLKRRLNNYLKLHFPSVKHLRACEYVLQRPLFVQGKRRLFPVWESSTQQGAIPVKTKWTNDLNLTLGGWVSISTTSIPENGYCSSCQIEVQASARNMQDISDKIDMADLLIISVDGEMYSKRHRFPDPSNEDDFAIGIGVSVARFRDNPNNSVGYYFALELSGEEVVVPPEDFTLIPFKKEHDLIEAYRDFLVLLDPDIVLGYNTNRFDWWYLGNRIPADSRFFYQGRIAAQQTPLTLDNQERAKKKKNNADEDEEQKKCLIHMPGRIQIDMLIYIKNNFKLRDYKLTTVSQFFLKDDKLDLKAEEMFQAFEDGMRGCLKIAAYCVQDTRLPLRLMHHTMTIPNLIEMGRVTSTLPQDLINRGQTFRLCNFFFREARKNQFVFTKFDDTSVPDYIGATVIPPKIGFYDNFLVTLDFASLYPSILIKNNLSHDTYLLPEEIQDRLQPLPLNVVGEDRFVNHVEGVLAKMEKQLLTLRRNVRKEMKTITDKQRLQMMDARQLALKLVCNALYGFTANALNPFNCPAVGRSITMLGREMIEKTKQLVEKVFDSTVIYGDTDSVFILFHKVTSLEEAFKLGKEAAEYVTNYFGGGAIELTMEKVLRPFLSLAKKRYAGIKYDSIDDKGKLYSKGLETVRRDVSPFVAKTYESILEAIVKKKDVYLAQLALHNRLCDLEDNKIPIEEFEISVSMKSSYKATNLPQLTVARKKKERNPGSEPIAGDRFTYVIVQGREGASVSEQAEDPEFVKAGHAQIDRMHYLKAATKPISNLFRAFTDDCSVLFRRTEGSLIRQRNKSHDMTLLFSGGDAKTERKMPKLPPKTEIKEEKDSGSTGFAAITECFQKSSDAAPSPSTPRRAAPPPPPSQPPKKKRKTAPKSLKTVQLDLGALFGKKS